MDKQPKQVEVKEELAVGISPEAFAKEFEALCNKTGYTIVPSLVWISRDDGTWSTKINLTVGALPKIEK